MTSPQTQIVKGMPRKEYKKQWYENNRTGSFENKINTLLDLAKSRAKKKGIEFSVTAEDFEPVYFCPLLPSIKLSFDNRPGDDNGTSMSLDRIDPTKGYTKENTWVISQRANRIKNNSTLDEFELIARLWRRKVEGDL